MIIYLWAVCFFSIFIALFWILTVAFLKFDDRKKLIEFPMVTIVVPMWNEGKTIVETLKSLNSMDYPKNKLEIIAVDD